MYSIAYTGSEVKGIVYDLVYLIVDFEDLGLNRAEDRDRFVFAYLALELNFQARLTVLLCLMTIF